MRLATFNLLHGRSPDDGLVDPERLTAAVGAIDADILALQEVDRDQSRSGGLDQTAIAARALGAAEHRFAAALVGTPGGVFRRLRADDDGFGQPCYGVGLVSRYPVVSWQVFRLRSSPVRSPMVVPGMGRRLVLLDDEPRVVLAAVVQTPLGRLTVAATHLSFVPGWNVLQLRQVLRALRSLPGPRLLMGDLNLPAGAVRLVTRWRPLGGARTFPSVVPRVQLDHMLADPDALAVLPPVRDVHTPLSVVSDHRPLVIDLG